MLLIELLHLINQTFQTGLPLIKLFEDSRLVAMATMVQGPVNGPFVSRLLIDSS